MKMSLRKSYREEFLQRLELLTAEELKSIFEKVFDDKIIDPLKVNNDILINSVKKGYKNINFKAPSYKKGNIIAIKSSKLLLGNEYKDGSYKMPKYNMLGIIQKAS